MQENIKIIDELHSRAVYIYINFKREWWRQELEIWQKKKIGIIVKNGKNWSSAHMTLATQQIIEMV